MRRLEDGLAFWQDTLGLRISKQATVADQGVKAALLPIGRSEIELLEPISNEGGVASSSRSAARGCITSASRRRPSPTSWRRRAIRDSR